MYLEVTIGNQWPVTYRLSRPEISIGSLPSNDICISDPTVSKKHLQLFFLEDQWFVVDGGSTNGSFLSHEQIFTGKVAPLKIEVELRLGDHVFLRLLDTPQTARVLELHDTSIGATALTDHSAHEKTRRLSIEEFRAAEAAAIERKRRLVKEKERARKARSFVDKESALKVLFACVLIVISAFVLEATWQSAGNLAREEFIQLPKDANSWRLPGSSQTP